MSMQSNSKGHTLASNMWAQLGVLAAATVIIIILAAQYVW